MNIITSGKSVIVSGNKIYIDGKLMDTGTDKEINVTIEGDCGELKVDNANNVEVKGNVTGNIQTHNAEVRCGKVGGSISTHNGNINIS